jgi:hypothetical protein
MLRLDELRKLTRAPGFIYTLSNIIINESIFYSAHDIKTRNRFDLISFNEIALLLSLMSEVPLNLSFPDSQEAERQYEGCKASLSSLDQNNS